MHSTKTCTSPLLYHGARPGDMRPHSHFVENQDKPGPIACPHASWTNPDSAPTPTDTNSDSSPARGGRKGDPLSTHAATTQALSKRQTHPRCTPPPTSSCWSLVSSPLVQHHLFREVFLDVTAPSHRLRALTVTPIPLTQEPPPALGLFMDMFYNLLVIVKKTFFL